MIILLPFTVIGFNQSQYRLEESADPYQLTVQVLSPPQSIVNDVGLIASATDGSAISKLLWISPCDFTVLSAMYISIV